MKVQKCGTAKIMAEKDGFLAKLVSFNSRKSVWKGLNLGRCL